MSYLKEKVAAPVWKTAINVHGVSAVMTIRRPSNHKIWHKNSPTGGGRSVGMVRLGTKSPGVCFCLFVCSSQTFNERSCVLKIRL
jgi:hypothetical protein